MISCHWRVGTSGLNRSEALVANQNTRINLRKGEWHAEEGSKPHTAARNALGGYIIHAKIIDDLSSKWGSIQAEPRATQGCSHFRCTYLMYVIQSESMWRMKTYNMQTVWIIILAITECCSEIPPEAKGWIIQNGIWELGAWKEKFQQSSFWLSEAIMNLILHKSGSHNGQTESRTGKSRAQS